MSFAAGILLLQPGDSFNYEEQTIYTLTFSVQDQHLPGLERKDLIINVTNVNEEPTIYITQRTIAFDEDMVRMSFRTFPICSNYYRENLNYLYSELGSL